MQKKIWEIIAVLIQYVIEEGEIGDERMWKASLNLQGYSPKEVNAAIAWIKAVMIDKGAVMMDKSMRVFASFEKARFSNEAQGFLLKLKEMGFIDSRLQEEIIERALMLDIPQIKKDDIKVISAMMLSASSKKNWKEKAIKIIEENWNEVCH